MGVRIGTVRHRGCYYGGFGGVPLKAYLQHRSVLHVVAAIGAIGAKRLSFALNIKGFGPKILIHECGL